MKKRIPEDGIQGQEALREASAGEFGQVMQLVSGAVRALAPDRFEYVEAIYADRVVVAERDGKMMAYPYTFGDDNKVQFAPPYEVVKHHAAVTMRESAQTGAFIEAKGDKDKGTRFRVRVIKSGLSKNKKNYPTKVLREAVGLFEGLPVFVKSDDEHLNGKGKDFRNLIGRLVEASYVDTHGGEGEIQATLELLESAGEVTAKLREAYDRGMADDLFGFSIDVKALVKKRRGGVLEAARFLEAKSLDLIIEPGAGGQIINLLEAYEEADVKLRERMIEAVKTANKGALPEGLDVNDDEQLEAAFREAVAIADTPEESAGGQMKASRTGGNAGAVAVVSQEDLREAMRMFEARADARVVIAESGLPEKAKNKLSNQFGAEGNYTIEQVREAIDDEREYLASMTESGHVQGMGDAGAMAGQDRSEKVAAMLDDFFDPAKPAMSFRECYVEITGDRGVTGLFQNVDQQRLREAVGAFAMREAVSAGTFGDILGDSITRRMQRDYRADDRYADWRDLADVVPVSDFRTQERGIMGGYGDLPVVAENGSYNALTTPGDEKATYALAKRGGKETVSIEAIANDDVGMIQRIPMKLTNAALRTLYKFVLGLMDGNPNVYDGVALFHASHGNLGTAALSSASFAATRLAMSKQTDLSGNDVLGLVPGHLWVPPDLEETAFDMFVRDTNNDETFVQSRKPRVHVVPHWTDANNWYSTADKRDVPLIEIGFYNGQEEPELFIQDNPSQGSLFSNDQITYKIRHIYSGTPNDFVGFQGNIVP